MLATLTWLGWGSSPHPIAPAPAHVEPVFYVPSAPDVLLTSVIGIWMSGVLVGVLRLLPSLHAVYTLRDRCRPFPPDIEARLPLWLEAKQRGRRSQLMVCDELPGATVLGLQRPCIAMPPLLVGALTIDELDQVILHEHAHVQRRDDWSRLVQMLLLSVVWMHPAAVLISRALNREREMACDEWVVARTGLPKAYARCLAHAAEIMGRTRAGSPLVPALIGRRHELLRRVDRLLGLNGHARRTVSLSGAALAAFAMVVVSAQLQGVRLAEIVDIALPHVSLPALAVYDARASVPMPSTFAPESVTASADKSFAPDVPMPVAPTAPIAPIAPVAPIAPAAPAPVAPIAPIAPMLPPRTGDPRGTWSALAAPGVEIASAAKKTSIGVANIFSRAGVSLGRSF